LRFLVTGHTGYIGPHVVELLMKDGHYVKGVDVGLYEGCDFYSMVQPQENLTRDIFDLEAADFEGIDAVIHLAGLSNDPLCEVDPGLTWRVNHEGTMHVARCAKAAGVPRFLFSSSCSIYGKSGDRALGEEDELDPITVYAESKVVCEQDLAAMADETFSPTYLRNATAYGTSPRLRLDLVVNSLLASGFTTGAIRILSDGSPWRPLVHCRDIARAFIHLAQAPREKVHNQAFNIGRTEENYQVKELAAMVNEVLPDCIIEYAGDASPDARDYKVDFSKFASAFPEFIFSSTVRDGTRELAEDYRQYGMTAELATGPKFNRLRTLQAQSLPLIQA
jgi:nucleoside-diphosphate-sugar epimerase